MPVVAGATATVLLVGGGGWWWRAQPPPETPLTVRLEATTGNVGFGNDGYITDMQAGQLTLPLIVASDDPPETVRVREVAGRLVRVDHVTRVSNGDSTAVWSAGVVLECDDEGLTALNSDFRIVVDRVDAWGRTSTVTQPIDPTVLDWQDSVRQVCAVQLLHRGVAVGRTQVVAGPGPLDVTVRGTVRNTLERSIELSAQGDSGTVTTWSPGTTIQGRSDAPFSVTLSRSDCATEPTGLEAFIQTGSQSGTSLDGITLFAALDAAASYARSYLPATDVVWHFTAAEHARALALLERLCAGAPRTPTAATVSSTLVEQETAQRTVIRAVLDLTAPGAQRVRLSNSDVIGGQRFSSSADVAAAGAAVVAGRARVPALITFDCNGDMGVPSARLDLTTARGTFPYRIGLGSPALASAVTAACPQVSLRDYGWPDEVLPG